MLSPAYVFLRRQRRRLVEGGLLNHKNMEAPSRMFLSQRVKRHVRWTTRYNNHAWSLWSTSGAKDHSWMALPLCTKTYPTSVSPGSNCCSSPNTPSMVFRLKTTFPHTCVGNRSRSLYVPTK